MSDLLFDTPWWLPTLLIVIGIVLFITGNNRQEVRIRTAGIIAVLLAVVVILLSYFVQTDREKAENGSRQLVAAAVAHKWAVFDQLLDPKASVTVLGAGTLAANRREIIEMAKDGTTRFGLKDAAHHIAGRQAGAIGGDGDDGRYHGANDVPVSTAEHVATGVDSYCGWDEGVSGDESEDRKSDGKGGRGEFPEAMRNKYGR